MSTPNDERWRPANEHNQCWGADLASATAISITHGYHRVTGTAAIETINLPWNTFAGEVTLLFTGAATTVTSGNIAIAITAVANQAVKFVYNPGQGKWYPVKY